MLIKVKASATLEIDPDYMELNITLISLDKEKEVAINNVMNNYNLVSQYFEEKEKENKFETISYEIQDKYKKTSYTNIKTKKIEEKLEFEGFLVKQMIQISLPIDILFATSLIANLTKKDEIYINIRYYLKDKKQFQDEVIKQAVENARTKAHLIANSGFSYNYLICEVLDYTYNPYDNYSKTSFINKCKVSNSIEELTKTLTPKKITLSENVYSEWIAKN